MNGKASISQWFKLFRAANLLMIIFTQVLAWFYIIRPLYHIHNVGLQLSIPDFILLVLTTVLIAAGGYLVNDIFDIDVDDFNKRNNIIIKKLSLKSAWAIYFILNAIAIALGMYLAIQAGSYQLGFVFIVIAGLLYLYSSRYQAKLLWGNIIIAFITAMVVLVVWLFEFMSIRDDPDSFVNALTIIPVISTFIWSYALFAFLLSIIREFIKDIQDIKGDTRFGSHTLPIAIGLPAMKIIIIAGIVISMVILAIGQAYLLKYGFRYAFWYLIMTVQAFFIYLIYLSLKAKVPGDFATPSLVAKIIMVAGILSMQLIYLDLA